MADLATRPVASQIVATRHLEFWRLEDPTEGIRLRMPFELHDAPVERNPAVHGVKQARPLLRHAKTMFFKSGSIALASA
jgi:hypothetical protein